MMRTCNDCELKYNCHPNSPYDICPLCQADLEADGININHKQPADKSDYKPRYNGMKPFGDK